MLKLPSAREIVVPFPIVRVYPAKDKVPDVSVSVPLTVVLWLKVTPVELLIVRLFTVAGIHVPVI